MHENNAAFRSFERQRTAKAVLAQIFGDHAGVLAQIFGDHAGELPIGVAMVEEMVMMTRQHLQTAIVDRCVIEVDQRRHKTVVVVTRLSLVCGK